jgi:hypothetical protein
LVINGPVTRIPTANGVSPLALENIIQLRLFLHDGNRWGWYYPVENLESPIIDLMGTRYLLTSRRTSHRLEQSSRFRYVTSLPLGHELFENLAVLPRFFLVHDVVSVKTLAEAREMIGAGQIDFRKTAIADRPVIVAPAAGLTEPETVQVLDYQPDSLSLRVRSAGTSLLVLSENYYPGWKAWVDEAPARVERVNIAFRGVLVPDGAHLLRMEFSPSILPLSLAITVTTAIGLALMVWAGTQRQRTAC